MAGIHTTIDSNYSVIADVFTKLERVPDNLFDPLDEIGQVLVFSAQENIRQSRDTDGNPLEELADSTRAKRGEDAVPLLDRSNLLDSYTHLPNNQSVEVGSDAIQAALMHFGGPAGRNHSVVVPARPVLGISDDDRIEIVEILREFVLGQVA